ncbi:leucine-rich repeat-containing protein 40-like [Aedes albopictus]|uniref:Dynein axonemal assembly factor 1 homolog n=1 Tax=Aedes albopictus TaxID=7160 RepID=A0ABM1XNX9_AEDAL|nr:leucine-rich repeat-containing protein 40-like [Aedes albopictus]
MKEIVVLLLLIGTFGEIKSFSVHLSKNEAEIRNFYLPGDAASVEEIPAVESLYFIYFYGNILPQNFTDQLQKCIHIKFHGGKVKTIHISPKLTSIELQFTLTENVIIERGKYYALEKFVCRNEKLTRIPENMNQLKKMKYLDLNSNLIQTVQIDQLTGLDNLESLDLFSNKIKQIYNHGLASLPSLTHLNLANNELKHIDVCSWHMPKLSHLNLTANKLTHFAINHFRGLKKVNLAGNPLNCVWKNSLLRNKSDMTIEGELTCDTDSKVVFGFDCRLTIDQLQQQKANFDSRLAQIEETVLNNNPQFSELSTRVQKLEVEVNKRFQKMEELLEKLSSKIVEQQNVANDIIEAIYRAEIERTYNTKKNP